VKKNDWEAFLECAYFSMYFFMAANSTAYIYSTLSFLAHLEWLKVKDHRLLRMMVADNQLYTEDECEAAFSVLARTAGDVPAQGEHKHLQFYWKNLAAIFYSRRAVRRVLNLERDLQVHQGLTKPSDDLIATLGSAFRKLVDECEKPSGHLRVLPNFAARVLNMQLDGLALTPIAELYLRPIFRLASLIKNITFYVEQNLQLLQPVEYESLVSQLVPVMYPTKPLPEGKKARAGDKIGYGWQFHDIVMVRKYGWGTTKFRVTAVEFEDDDGGWEEIWLVPVDEIPDDINEDSESEFYHGAEGLPERLFERRYISKVKRNGRWIKPEDVHI